MKQTQLKNKFEIAENSKAKVKFPKIKLKRRRKIYICICMAMCVRKHVCMCVCVCTGVHSVLPRFFIKTSIQIDALSQLFIRYISFSLTQNINIFLQYLHDPRTTC